MGRSLQEKEKNRRCVGRRREGRRTGKHGEKRLLAGLFCLPRRAFGFERVCIRTFLFFVCSLVRYFFIVEQFSA